IPELKFVPRLRKARPPQPSSAHSLAFLKGSPALPPVPRLPIRALVRLVKCLQREHGQRQQSRRLPILVRPPFGLVPPRSLQFDKEQDGLARSVLALAPATILELNFV